MSISVVYYKHYHNIAVSCTKQNMTTKKTTQKRKEKKEKRRGAGGDRDPRRWGERENYT